MSISCWLWATAFFVYQGAQWVKSMRYILPVYPFFILFAAYWLSNFRFRIPALRTGARISNLTLGKKTAAVLTTLVVVGTLAWAWGFTRIYTRPVTRITASRWIYNNVPTAATLHYSASSEEHVLQFSLPNAVTYDIGQPATIPFRVPVTATVESITMNYLADPKMDPALETFRVTVADDPFGNTALAHAEVTGNFAEGGDARGKPFTFPHPPCCIQGAITGSAAPWWRMGLSSPIRATSAMSIGMTGCRFGSTARMGSASTKASRFKTMPKTSQANCH
jgi:hypothetical protein